MAYTLSVYVSAPGTPLADGSVSQVGHVWYEVSNGVTKNSFGFALTHDDDGKPVGKGLVNGHGSDTQFYTQHIYRRTMEVTPLQYQSMLAFGKEHERNTASHTDSINSTLGGFSSERYNGLTNSCVDFTYAALKQGGLVPKYISMQEGNLKPTQNPALFDMIDAPYPNSPLNSTERNPKPKQTFMQNLLSEAEQVDNVPKSAGRQRLDSLLAASEQGDDALRVATSNLYDSAIGQQISTQASQVVNMQEQQAIEQQQQALAQQLADAPVRSGPVMKIG